MNLAEVPFEDLKIGDKVLSAIGNPGKIVDLYKKGTKSIFSPKGEKQDAVTVEWNMGSRSHFLYQKDGAGISYLGS